MSPVDININNDDFLEIISDILCNEEFLKLKEYRHHSGDRLQHSLNVAYYSFVLAKKMHLDYRKVTRAALLHDFFLVDNASVGKKKRLKTLIEHPKYALNNSTKYFELSDMEKNIIVSHMFPLSFYLPKYKESVLVDLVDDFVALREAMFYKKSEMNAAFSFLFILLINYMTR